MLSRSLNMKLEEAKNLSRWLAFMTNLALHYYEQWTWANIEKHFLGFMGWLWCEINSFKTLQMKNYYKFKVRSHNTTLFFNIFYFIFHFRLHLLKFLCIWFFLVDSLEAKHLMCFNRYHWRPISLEKKFPIISKCIISQIMLSVLTVSIMGLITFFPISVFQILIIIPSLSQCPAPYSLPWGIMQSSFALSAVIWSQFSYWQFPSSAGAEVVFLSLINPRVFYHFLKLVSKCSVMNFSLWFIHLHNLFCPVSKHCLF